MTKTYQCTKCGKEFKEGEKCPTKGHNFVKYVEVKK